MRPVRVFPPGANDVIRRLYPDVTAIAAEFAAANPDLPLIAAQQIRNRAIKIGAAKLRATPRFTVPEDILVHRHYPDRAACARALPERSWTEVQRRAWYLRRIAFVPPVEADDALIRRLYPDIAAIEAENPALSEAVIERRARQLGIGSAIGKHRRYRPRELRLVRLLYPDYGLMRALMPDRTKEALKALAGGLRLTLGKCGSPRGGHANLWTAEERAALAIPGATLPGRTAAAIDSARRRYQIGLPVDPDGSARDAEHAARDAADAMRRSEARQRAAEVRRLRAETLAAERLMATDAARAAAIARRAEQERERAARAARREVEKQESAERRRLSRIAAKRAARAAAAQERARRASERAQIEADARAMAAARWTGPDLNPHVIARAGRSPFGLGLVSEVQRAVPRDLWPHVKPRVIEDLVLSVVEGRCMPDDLPAMLPAAFQAVMRAQFVDAGR